MKKNKGINRRGFIKASALGAIGAGSLLTTKPSKANQEDSIEIPKIKEYRTLGRTGFRVSDIGIGTSRYYTVPVMNAILDAGVNYIDTAEGYGRGSAEKNIAEAIKGRDRKSIFISSKIGIRGITSKEQVVEKVQQCLERLQTDYIDCLMMSGASTVESLKDENFHQGMDQLKNEGKIRFIGVSHHGSRMQGQEATMSQIILGAVEDGRFDLLLFVYNFIQKEEGEKILEAASKKNVATTIMKSNPLGRYYEMKTRVEEMKSKGQEIDERTQRFMTEMEETAKKAENFINKHNLKNPNEIKTAALRFVLSNPEVNTLNLGFNNYDDVKNYLILSGSRLGESEGKLLAAYQKECGQLYCRHACGICESSCPYNVPVNTIMRYNHYFEAPASEKYAMQKYAELATPKADYCKSCTGWCERSCPYGVPIQGLLNMAHNQLTLG